MVVIVKAGEFLFSSGTGKENVNECLDCPGGKYCEFSGQPNATGPCDPGFYCEKSATPTPTGLGGNVCPQGHFCPQVSLILTLIDIDPPLR